MSLGPALGCAILGVHLDRPEAVLQLAKSYAPCIGPVIYKLELLKLQKEAAKVKVAESSYFRVTFPFERTAQSGTDFATERERG